MVCRQVWLFPAYVLGHMLAAQIFEALEADMPKMRDAIVRSDFIKIKNWLASRIYMQGRLMPMEALVRSATGHDFDGEALKRHIKGQYL